MHTTQLRLYFHSHSFHSHRDASIYSEYMMKCCCTRVYLLQNHAFLNISSYICSGSFAEQCLSDLMILYLNLIFPFSGMTHINLDSKFFLKSFKIFHGDNNLKKRRKTQELNRKETISPSFKLYFERKVQTRYLYSHANIPVLHHLSYPVCNI